MKNSTFISLLEEKRKDIIQTIKQTVIESFTPYFYGMYEIYINEEDGQIHLHKVDLGEASYQLEAPMRYLFEVPSHTLKKGDFKEWLKENDRPLPPEYSKEQRRAYYKARYQALMNRIRINALDDIIYADDVYDAILELYKTNNDITYEDILECCCGEGA